jgi:hypothetical protein
MAQLAQAQLTCPEADILLTIAAIDRAQFKTERRAASTFNVPRSTLRDRRAGVATRRDCEPNSKKLTKLEEEVIARYILDLDSRGFAPSLGAIQDIADKLLTERSARKVGKLWPYNFVKRTESLTIRFNQAYDRQRALCEDSEVISSWFKLV